MRRLSLVALLCVLALAGCGQLGADGGPPDPANDTIGWEDGYWYNESININGTDGLSRAERERLIARSMARVEQIRQLEFEKRVNITVRTRENYSIGGGGTDPALARFDNVKFESLFLIGEQNSSIQVQQDTRNQTTGGFYDPESDSIVIASDATGPTLTSERVLAHELVHALQDQQLNLSITRSVGTRDAFGARTGLIEGDATVVENEYMGRCGEAWSCLNVSTGSESDASPPANYGPYLLEFFPYSDGPGFIQALRNGDNWSAVNAAYSEPPTSAQVVIDPSLYGEFDGSDVQLRDRTDGDWTRIRPPDRPDFGTVGRAGLGAMFARTIYHEENPDRLVEPTEFLNLEPGGTVNRSDPLNYNLSATEGWTGDRLHAYQQGNQTAYVWRLTWASSAAAERFADAYRELLGYWDAERVAEGVWVAETGPFADAYRLQVEGSVVTVTSAPTRAALDEVRRP